MQINKNYNLIIGRHCLNKKPDYLLGALKETLSLGANSLMIYSGAPQNTSRQPLENWGLTKFKELLVVNNIDIKNVIVHGPYLVNLANTYNEKIFDFSVSFLSKEVARVEEGGFKTMVIHPGSSLSGQPEKSILQIARGLDLVLQGTSQIRIALETTCKRGGEMGGSFEQLKKIIDNVEQKERVGICLDTCHLYAVGYDVKNNLEGVIKEFEEKIGLDKLWVIHLNDSGCDLGENIDRHKNIGQGKIGFAALKRIVWHPKFDGIPKLLETPRSEKEHYLKEIRELINNDDS